MTVHAMIYAAMERLSPSEQRLAKVLLASYPSAGLKTVAELAARAQVSGATVVRFVRHLGFNGYPDFHQCLHEEVQQSAASPLQRYESHQVTHRMGELESTLAGFEQGLRQTFARTTPAEIKKVVALLADPDRRILCAGGRFSGMLAQYLAQMLTQLREQVSYVPGGTEWANRLLDIGKRDLLVMFDFRRYQADSVRFARACRKHGATVILITDPWLSPIAEVSKHVLTCEVDSTSPYITFVPAMAMVERLVSELIDSLGGRARERLEKLEAVWQEITNDNER
ncbi:MurR/RpiR family transcriptional regulator [Pseudomonas batumici]|uniref:Transcriptional regulator, RpiR family n=2 Tax=Pseudomonas batumici TaxID=226910 RepID=A0A0C2EC81_9PSED|nr:Transcriptional regulator, RpiR family [Pseudomonas batumici]